MVRDRQSAKERLTQILNQIVRMDDFQEEFYRKPLEAMLELTDDAQQVLRQLDTTIQSYDSLMEKLEVMSGYAAAIEAREPQILAEYRERLMAKVREILGDHSIDEDRLATEVVLYADKICTDEETVRLRSHIDAMKKELAREGSIGRKLDFLAQEMNREANTILSKSSDLQTSDTGIALKTDIEKVREQIQNIE